MRLGPRQGHRARRLTQFPEEPKRGIGFTAPWPEET
jgi:hypothetical protein